MKRLKRMKRLSKYDFFVSLKIVLALVVVATTMAVSCPGPIVPTPEPPTPPPVSKSVERNSFESSYDYGLYMKGAAVVVYDVNNYQMAYNLQRITFRVQSDDQMKYVHVDCTEEAATQVDETTLCKVTYRAQDDMETVLIIKFIVVKVDDKHIWLWNELQKTGVIVPMQ